VLIMATRITFEDAENRGATVSVDAHPQTSIQPGEKPDTSIINSPDGKRYLVVGDYRDVQLKIQAAAAQGHESGDTPRTNTPMS
jgi:hypothetical protein